jgi:hypothetical protein
MWNSNTSLYHKSIQNKSCLAGNIISMSFEVNIMRATYSYHFISITYKFSGENNLLSDVNCLLTASFLNMGNGGLRILFENEVELF